MTGRAVLIIALLCLPLDIETFSQPDILRYNVVWNTPSDDSFGSMPLGNGDIGLNVWVEKSGDLVFYISKVDAFDAGHFLPKLGRVRLRTEPALPVDQFKQTLSLIDASVMIEAGDARFRVWVDANQPMIRVEGLSRIPRTATISLETLCPLVDAAEPLPQAGTVGLLFDDQEDRLAWCYCNQSSSWSEKFRDQNTPELVARTKDPVLHRTSGCLLQAKGFTRENPTRLKRKKASTSFDCSVKS